ncbi:mitochondrial phenylalanyl-tRNA synthetase alpha subunit, active as a monomer [Protomyces lactucae-debilis]|uniref:Phenylalanine--tRNA ligase, mitochondrial n=1 Tax=Protomyces lactucae-debilis TaxID=2754530 RepID=A0A1Y2FV71_PROLT|nr:mitochondrial phenylalanyl-tRNA synthetase alpha subunit, active as a monomer [Protomyces lactucae-debilis]ORY87076.1 mitochondrial phenylalanyl-tRNA synthetase alpha subunit, active as a monomer [Protomyces lactucae-debilis]
MTFAGETTRRRTSSSCCSLMKRLSGRRAQSSSSKLDILGQRYKTDSWTNVSSAILPLLPRKLHLQQNHPIAILRAQIESQLPASLYTRYNDFSPAVTVHQNFDSLGFPADHVGRSKSDTYYINQHTVLRTHTSAHQADCFRSCNTAGFLISADVYRRDEIDRSHYPVFHQMEGARIWKASAGLAQEIDAELATLPALSIVVEDENPPNHAGNPVQPEHERLQSEAVARHLKRTIEGIAAKVFQTAAERTQAIDREPLRVRWIEAYFPFTSPSWELEVFWEGEWLELCGCGVVRHALMTGAGKQDHIGWAFGLGLERIAMVLFGIPDIRLFWSLDERFLSQFAQGLITAFQPYSKYPGTFQDVSFWTSEAFQENDFMEIIRSVGGDLIENVKQVDHFKHPKTGKTSLCYRIHYRSMDKSLSMDEVNVLQDKIRALSTETLGVQLR